MLELKISNFLIIKSMKQGFEIYINQGNTNIFVNKKNHHEHWAAMSLFTILSDTAVQCLCKLICLLEYNFYVNKDLEVLGVSS